MKKTALAILTLFLSVEIVSACEFSREEENFRNQLDILNLIFVFSSYALMIPIIVLYFLRKHIGMWTINAGLVSLVFFLPFILFAAGLDMCGYSGYMIGASEFIFMLFLFTFQLLSWISQKKTSLKLR